MLNLAHPLDGGVAHRFHTGRQRAGAIDAQCYTVLVSARVDVPTFSHTIEKQSP
jgi:hypothetical protein